MFTGELYIFAVVQVTDDIFFVSLKHMSTETYSFLMEDLLCADLTDQVLVYFDVADLGHRVFRKAIYGMRKNE